MAIAAAEGDILLARARRGDLEAVENLFRAYSGRVYTLARRMCRTPQDAEDIVQETFVEVARSIAKYRGDGPLGAWIHRVAASKALMHLRRDRPVEWGEEFDGDALPAPGTAPPHERLDLEAALSRLSDSARAVVWLHDAEGYTHEEIASMTGLTPSYSKSKLARAHEKLRKLLSPREDDHAPQHG